MATNNAANYSPTQYNVQTGGANGTLNNVAPSATSGNPLISQGSSSQPIFSAYPQVTGLGVGASAGSTAGITFDATNFMNAYDTGSITPVLRFGGGTTGITYSKQEGKYWRIGALVFFHIVINLTNKGSSTGAATIAGLPFTSANDSQSNQVAVSPFINTYPSGCTMIIAYVGANSQIVNLAGAGAANNTNLTHSNFANTDQFSCSGFYWTA